MSIASIVRSVIDEAEAAGRSMTALDVEQLVYADHPNEVESEAVSLMRGEATGNTHLLDAVRGEVLWGANPHAGPTDLTYGILHVPDGAVAHLLHTDEHGCNGIGPGTYRLVGKREMAEEIRRVAD